MTMSSADRNLPRIVEDQPLPHVEVGISSLGGQVKRVSWEFLVAGSRHQRVGRVIDGMRPCVRALDSKATRKSLRDVHLQCVIDRGGRPRKECRMEEGVVVDSIERQYSRFGTEIKIVELKSSLIALA